MEARGGTAAHGGRGHEAHPVAPSVPVHQGPSPHKTVLFPKSVRSRTATQTSMFSHAKKTLLSFPLNTTAQIITFQLHNFHSLSSNILANKLQALLFQTLFQDWIHLLKHEFCWPLGLLCFQRNRRKSQKSQSSTLYLKSVAVPLFQVIWISIEFPWQKQQTRQNKTAY